MGDQVKLMEQKASERDEVFSLLSNRRRRYAIQACKESESPLDVSDVAERVAEWEYGKERSELGSDERKRVYTAMMQSHLPAMEKAGVVEYDGRKVSLTEKAQEVEVYMDVVPDGSVPWGQYYLGLSVVSALVLVGVWAGVYPESIPDSFWAAAIVTVFGVSSAYHAYRSRGMRLGLTEIAPGER